MSRCSSLRRSLYSTHYSPWLARQPLSASRVAPAQRLGPVRHLASASTATRPQAPGPSYRAASVLGSLLGGFLVWSVSSTGHDWLDTWNFVAPTHEYSNPEMPTESAPGRVGNLTPEEKVKLQEAWRRLSKICGIPLDEEEEDAGPDDAADTQVDGAVSTKEAKKSRRPRFRRKKTDTVNTADQEDDKYGQAKEFQTALKENTPQDIRETMWTMVKMDHPDALMLRFLRARKWDIDKALIMMISTLNWRKRDMHIEDTIVRDGEAVGLKESLTKDDEGFMAQYRMGKSFIHGVDKDGRPICIIRVRKHVPGAHTVHSLETYTVHTIETCRMALRDPVDTATLIFDMTDFSLKNMDNAPVRFMIKCFEANYPESLGIVAVHNAPWIFQGIWKLIRGWLDPVVASKIHFTSSTQDLEAFIPRKNILKEFGGDDDWEYEYKEPTKEENAKMADTATRDQLIKGRQELILDYEDKTRQWLKFAPTEPEFEALSKERNDIAEKLRVDYWRLDPYVRARSLYDRTGIINEGGKIVFYPYRSDSVEKAEGIAGVGHGQA